MTLSRELNRLLHDWQYGVGKHQTITFAGAAELVLRAQAEGTDNPAVERVVIGARTFPADGARHAEQDGEPPRSHAHDLADEHRAANEDAAYHASEGTYGALLADRPGDRDPDWLYNEASATLYADGEIVLAEAIAAARAEEAARWQAKIEALDGER